MALHMWTMADGTTMAFDTDSGLLTEGSNEPRTPTEDEMVFITTTFLTPAPEQAVLTAHEIAVNALSSALATLRQATADGVLTTQEATSGASLVIPALEKVRDLGSLPDDVAYLSVLVLAQAAQALYMIAGQNLVGLQALASQNAALRTDITALQAQVAALQAEQPPTP